MDISVLIALTGLNIKRRQNITSNKFGKIEMNLICVFISFRNGYLKTDQTKEKIDDKLSKLPLLNYHY